MLWANKVWAPLQYPGIAGRGVDEADLAQRSTNGSGSDSHGELIYRLHAPTLVALRPLLIQRTCRRNVMVFGPMKRMSVVEEGLRRRGSLDINQLALQ